MRLDGLSSDELRVYEFLIDEGPTPVNDLLGVVPNPADVVDRLRRGAYILGDPPRARRPSQAFAVPLARGADYVERLALLAEELDQRFIDSPHYADVAVPVTTLTSRQEVSAQFDALQRRVNTSWDQLLTGPFLELADPLPPEEAASPAPRRLVYEKAVLGNEKAMNGVRNSLRYPGTQIRFIEHLPTKLLIVDNEIALTPLEEGGSLPMLVLRAAPLVAAHAALFESWWSRAQPYNASDVIATPPEVTEKDKQILQQVLAGETDQNIARMYGVSPRTIGRSIQKMRELARVTTRAQLIHYATKHWL